MKNLALVLASIFACLLAAEGALRLLPVRENVDPLPVTAADPIIRHMPNTEITWSKGPFLDLATVRHSNNVGFLNDQDYWREGKRPLLAFIGDSFVEALMVPYDQTISGRLAKTWPGRVYSFGMSSSPLSQYLAFARYARDTYHPDYFVFVIISNDFDESWWRNKGSRAFWYFDEGLVPYQPSWKRWLVNESRLLRYGCEHLYLCSRLGMTTAGHAVGPDSDWREAADLFLARLEEATGVPKDHIALLVDSPDAPGWKFRGEFIAKARGFHVVDLQSAERWPGDSHWDGEGHRQALEALEPVLSSWEAESAPAPATASR